MCRGTKVKKVPRDGGCGEGPGEVRLHKSLAGSWRPQQQSWSASQGPLEAVTKHQGICLSTYLASLGSQLSILSWSNPLCSALDFGSWSLQVPAVHRQCLSVDRKCKQRNETNEAGVALYKQNRISVCVLPQRENDWTFWTSTGHSEGPGLKSKLNSVYKIHTGATMVQMQLVPTKSHAEM
jgi:hypothetical protein